MTAGGGILIGGVAWGRNQNIVGDLKEVIKNQRADLDKKIDDHIEDNKDSDERVSGQLQRQWAWQSSYEKEAAERRFDIQKQMGKFEATLSIHDNQYGEILRLIQSMSKDLTDKIDKLEKTVEQLRRN